jgi:hypothetical protein
MSAQKGQETAPTTFLEAELRKLGHPNFGKKPPSKPRYVLCSVFRVTIFFKFFWPLFSLCITLSVSLSL